MSVSDRLRNSIEHLEALSQEQADTPSVSGEILVIIDPDQVDQAMAENDEADPLDQQADDLEFSQKLGELLQQYGLTHGNAVFFRLTPGAAPSVPNFNPVFVAITNEDPRSWLGFGQVLKYVDGTLSRRFQTQRADAEEDQINLAVAQLNKHLDFFLENTEATAEELQTMWRYMAVTGISTNPPRPTMAEFDFQCEMMLDKGFGAAYIAYLKSKTDFNDDQAVEILQQNIAQIDTHMKSLKEWRGQITPEQRFVTNQLDAALARVDETREEPPAEIPAC